MRDTLEKQASIFFIFMEKKTYIELLKDPRWQKKRLEIMQRDGFKCQHCLATDKSLQVHHLVYHKGAKPWEYKDEELITLCEHCHEYETEDNAELYSDYQELVTEFKMSKFSIGVLVSLFSELIGYMRRYNNSNDEDECGIGIIDGSIKNLIETAVYCGGTSGDVIIAQKMGIDMSPYLENVSPEMREKLTYK